MNPDNDDIMLPMETYGFDSPVSRPALGRGDQLGPWAAGNRRHERDEKNEEPVMNGDGQ